MTAASNARNPSSFLNLQTGAKLHVGLIVTLSGRWPRELPEKRLAEYSAWARDILGKEEMELFLPDHVLSTPEETTEAIQWMKSRLVDVVVMVYGAFTGDDIAAALKQRMDVPLILWAPYEPPYAREERLWANALCAMTMNVAALGRLGYTCHTVYGGHEDPRAEAKVLQLLRGYAVRKAMGTLRLGLFGYRPTNYYVSTFDEAVIRRTFGITMNATELKEVCDDMEALDPAEVEADMRAVVARWDTQLPEGHLEKHSRLYLSLKRQMKLHGYDFGIIKCWPEMTTLHIQPCAVLGRLADDGFFIGCEGDVDAGITQMMEALLVRESTFITDLIDVDEKENTVTFWHCGNAAPSLHAEKYHPELRNHPLVGQGSAFWTALKPGEVTIARLHNFHGEYRMVLLHGQALDRDRNTRGCMAVVRLESPVRTVLEQVIANEIPHHFCVAWADCREALRQTAELMHIPVLAF